MIGWLCKTELFSIFAKILRMKKLILLLSTAVLFSCGNKGEKEAKVDGEVVNFSATANGSSDKSNLPVIINRPSLFTNSADVNNLVLQENKNLRVFTILIASHFGWIHSQ